MNLKAVGTPPIQSDAEQFIIEKYASGGYEKQKWVEIMKYQKDMELIDILTLRKNHKLCCVDNLLWLIYHNTIKNIDRNQRALEEVKKETQKIQSTNSFYSFGSLEEYYTMLYHLFFDRDGAVRTEPYLTPLELDCNWNRALKDMEISAWDELHYSIYN